MSEHQTSKGPQGNSAMKACLFLRQVRSTLHMIFLQLTLIGGQVGRFVERITKGTYWLIHLLKPLLIETVEFFLLVGLLGEIVSKHINA